MSSIKVQSKITKKLLLAMQNCTNMYYLIEIFKQLVQPMQVLLQQVPSMQAGLLPLQFFLFCVQLDLTLIKWICGGLILVFG